MPRNLESYHGTPSSKDALASSFELLKSTQSPVRKKTGENPQYPLKERVKEVVEDSFHLLVVSRVKYGDPLCDVETFEKHLNAARTLENTKVVFLGELVSNRPLTDAIPLEEQMEYMKDWIDTLDAENKIFAGVRSNYPRISVRSKGFQGDINDELYRGVSFPVLQNGGVIEVALEDPTLQRSKKKKKHQVYEIGLYSQDSMAKPAVNKNAAAKRIFLEKMAGAVDIMIAGGSFDAAVGQELSGHNPTRKNLTLISAGTYRGNSTGERVDLIDKATRDRYGVDTEPSGQVITLFTREKDTRVNLMTADFAYDHTVRSASRGLERIAKSGKMEEYFEMISREHGIVFSPEQKTALAKDSEDIRKILGK